MNNKSESPPADISLSDYLKRHVGATDFLNKETVSNITIILTYKCPAACPHCVFESHPQRREVVDSEIAKRYIMAAARQTPRPPTLSFSGGEAFLYPKLLRELMELGAELGIPSEVISSSAWCKTREYARDTLKDLKSRGLTSYCTSVDRYHTPHISAENMRNGILAALDTGLRVVINSVVDPTRMAQEEDYLSETLDLDAETLAACHINRLICAPVGRAETGVTDFLYQDKDFREGCPYSTEVITLTPHGLLYPCCGMVVGEPQERAGLFIQERLADKTVEEIAEILDDLKHDLFFKLLQVYGPYRLLQELKRRRPEITTREKFVGSCDVCLEFTRNPDVITATHEFLEECAALLTAPANESAVLK